jgi:hypothetical protein
VAGKSLTSLPHSVNREARRYTCYVRNQQNNPSHRNGHWIVRDCEHCAARAGTLCIGSTGRKLLKPHRER